MQKLAVGPRVPAGAVDINAPVDETLRRIASLLNKRLEELTVCVLDRPRHETIIQDIRQLGARITLIGDGDVAGVMNVADPDSGIDVYMGTGGAPEGVLAAAALRCVGGQIQAKLLFRNDQEHGRAVKVGITDFNRVYDTDDLARGHVIFCAAGVTTGALLRGVEFNGNAATTHTTVLDSHSGKVQHITTRHPRFTLLNQ